MTDLKEGDVVLIRAFDDWPAHLFLVFSTYEECVTGYSITGPMRGDYGEPGFELIDRLVFRPEPDNSII